MNDQIPDMPAKLVDALQYYYAGSRPSPEFSAELRAKLDARQAQLVEKSSTLRSESKSLKKTTKKWLFNRSFLSRPAYAVLIAVLGLLLISGIVYAVGRIAGYIPRYGLVEEQAQVRILANAVSQSQDGIVVEVQQAVLTPEKTSITFGVTGVPLYAIRSGAPEEAGRICQASQSLILPDGSSLGEIGGGYGGYDQTNNDLSTYYFPPLPAGADRATLSLPCLPDTLLGLVPDTWEIPLAFKNAPQNLTIFPVQTISPGLVTPAVEAYPLTLDKVVTTEDGYIFMGSLRLALPGIQIVDPRFSTPLIFDANGDPIPYNLPVDFNQQSDENGIFHWSYQVHTKDIAWPVRIKFDAMELNWQGIQYQFELDTGSDPQVGQTWQLNQDIHIGSSVLRVDKVTRIRDGYLLSISSDKEPIWWLDINIAGNQASTNIKWLNSGSIEYYLHYSGVVPTGELKFTISNAGFMIPGPWEVKWQP